MIVGTGIDIIEIDRIKKAVRKESFLNKIFTKKEIKLFNKNKFNSIAGNFAAKEAVSKALGTGFRKFNPIDIEVLRDSYGKPYVILYNNAIFIKDSINANKIHLTISHCNNYAIAYAIAEM